VVGVSTARDSLLVQIRPPGGRGETITLPCPADLRFDHDLPGGAKSLSCTLMLPAGTATPSALSNMAQVRVVDRRSGQTVWFGYLTDPGLSADQAAQSYAVTAHGAQLLTDGWREVFGLVDRAQGSWQAVGDFRGGQPSMSGDLTASGDYTLDPGDFGDLTNFGDDLAIDFTGDFINTGDLGDFGGDLGDFNNIDFSGIDYPNSGSYPGYLGYLENPFDPQSIPLWQTSDGAWWARWEEGLTSMGGSAAGTTSGILTAGPAAPGQISRKRIGDPGRMAPINYYAGNTPGWAPFFPEVSQLGATFRITGLGASVRIWMWADSTVSKAGYFVQLNSSGLLTICHVVNGVEIVLASSTESFTPSIGITYSITFKNDSTYNPGPPVQRRQIFHATVQDDLYFPSTFYASCSYDSGYYSVASDGADYVFTDDKYWGVAAAGSGGNGQSVTFDAIWTNVTGIA
jgi:hypothetical protein